MRISQAANPRPGVPPVQRSGNSAVADITVRSVFSAQVLARLAYDEPVMTRDRDTGIELRYRFEHLAGGKLRMTGGLQRDRMLSVGCEPDDINMIATIMLAGVTAQLG